MKFYYLTLLYISLLIVENNLLAQDPILYYDFEPSSSSLIKPSIPKEEAVYVVDLQESQYAEGIKGMALDLSDDAILRSPLKLKDVKVPDYNASTSFSIQVWVRTKRDATMGTPIAGNMSSEISGKQGWQIGTRENGAWSLYLSDGKTTYEYKPTAKQRINDGRWHQIVISLDADKDEAWMFLDGKNLAIYNIESLKQVKSEFTTVIGGADEKWEYGSGGQWYAFNGYLDEVKIWSRTVTSAEVRESYSEFMKIIEPPILHGNQLKVLAWNIWHGGHRYGNAVGLQRVIDVIKDSNADVVGLIETYGSGEVIADSLGYYFYLVSSNLSIMSRYPIVETVKGFRSFNFGGAKLDLGNGQELLFLDTWLHYLPSVYKSIEDGKSVEYIIAEEGKTRHDEVQQILKEIKPWLDKSGETPVVMSGDFNSGSHLDWIEDTKKIHYGYVVEWPVSKEMIHAGFKDSYRELHIDPLLDPGLTWTPRAATSSKKYGLRDRIDYIYYQGKSLRAIESKVVDYHPVMFPSDHAGVVTVFKLAY